MWADIWVRVIVFFVEQESTYNYLNIAACAIYAYDRTLTFFDELDLIWRRRRISVATGLYLLLHVSFAAHLCLQVALVRTTTAHEECTGRYIITLLDFCMSLLWSTAGDAFLALRAYAITNRSVPLTASMVSLSLLNLVLNIWLGSIEVPRDLPQPFECALLPDVKIEVIRIVTVIAQLLGILPSTMLAAATWHHTSSVQAIMMLQKQQRPPITMVLLRDGTIYFLITGLLLILNTILTEVDVVMFGGLTPLISSLQMIMLSRFYIDLHRSSSGCRTSSILSNLSTVSDVRFVRIVGQLGESLSHHASSSSVQCTVTTDEYVYADGEELGNGRNGTLLIVAPPEQCVVVE